MSAKLKPGIVTHCAENYARALISIVQPKVLFLLGEDVTRAMFAEFGVPAEDLFNDIVDAPAHKIHDGPWLVAVSHPGGRGWANRRLRHGVKDRETQHLTDWRRWEAPAFERAVTSVV